MGGGGGGGQKATSSIMDWCHEKNERIKDSYVIFNGNAVPALCRPSWK